MQAVRKVLTTLTLAGLLFGFGTSASAAPKITITATPSSLSFSAKLGAGAPAAQVVSIGGTSTSFAVSADQSWIVFPATSNTNRGLRVSVNIGGLAAGTYTGHALLSGAHIANSPLSIPITLVISPKVTATAPAITSQPSNQTVNVTQTGTFSVAASGTAPLTYQWSKNGAAVSGATSATYTTPATLNTDNGASFSVTVANSAGVATSNSAVLTVIPAAIAPAITTQPVSQTVNAGQTATFSVVATGTAPLVYQWTKNGAAVFGASSATYTTPATVAADTLATFAVTVHNAAGNATSSAATLTVASSAVTINAAPASLSFALTLGGTAPAQQSVTINGSSPSAAQAFSLSADQTWIKLEITSGSTPVTTKVSVATGNLAAGTYNGHVLITAAGVTNSPLSVPVTLVISPAATAPAITGQPTNQTVNVTQAGTFSVAASGTAPLTYQWSKNGAALSGATSATYTTPATSNTDNGASFSVTVGNTAGTATSNAAILTVTPAAIAPAITSQPIGLTVNAGQSATFSVAATGTAPLTYQWSKNGAAVSGATSATYTTPATLNTDNGTSFSVAVGNTAGSATSNAATLTVSAPPPVTPGCVSSNASNWTNIALAVPQTSTFHMEFDATPSAALLDSVVGISAAPAGAYTDLAAIIRFSVAGVIEAMNATAYQAATVIPYSAGVNYHFALDINISNHTYNVSVIPAGGSQIVIGTAYAFRSTQAAVTTLSNIGSLNSLGATSICNVVTTNPVVPQGTAPTITTAPVSQTVTAGQTATFSVAASGTAPFTYQWTKNGAAVAGATSATYTTPATVAADTLSTFAVTVNNAAGNATSSSATLTVASSAVTISAAPASFSFAFTLGGTAPAQQSATINSSSVSAGQSFSMSADQAWITLGATSGSTPGTTTISVATGSLAAGTYNGHLIITAAGVTNSPLSVPVTLVISPATLASSLTMNPSSLNFPNVTVATSSVQGISVTNSGTATINVSNVSISGPGFTGSGVSAGLILAPSQTAMLNVTFAPAAAGSVGGSVTVTSNATNSPSSMTLSGTGVAAVVHSVALAWSEGTSGVSSYNIYRSSVSGGPYTKVNASVAPAFSDTAVTSGQYYYVVTAIANSMESTYSSEVPALVP